MWSGAAAILVLATVLASEARAQSSVPDASTTPGGINPAVTQKTIGETICTRGWTRMVRPPVHYTGELKRQQIRAFGYDDRRLSHYEEDHLIPLRLGGAPSDPRNLWPEPRISPDGWGADRKDEVEFALNQLVCSASAAARGPAGDRDGLDRRLSALCWITSLTRRSAPGHTVRTRNRRPATFARRVPLGGGGRVDAPLSRAVEGERWRSKTRVLRPPSGPSHPKAAISASAAWRPTVAGPATGGSYGFHFSPVMWV
jgi:hypothetical protein